MCITNAGYRRQNAPPDHMRPQDTIFIYQGACIDIPLSRRDARSRTGGALTVGARSRRRGRGAQCAFLRDLAALCALKVIGSNGNLSGGDKPLEQSCDIAPDHMGRSAIPTPNRYFWPKSSRTSGPAHQVVGEKAKLLRHLQTFENSILIRVHVQNLRFSAPDVFSQRVAARLSAETRSLNFNRRFGCASLPQPCVK